MSAARIFFDPGELPDRIRIHLEQAQVVAGNFCAAVKTSHKPNATIPLLWLVVHRDGLLFCCTHKTRGIFKQYLIDEIDSVRISQASASIAPRLEVVSADLEEDDFSVTLPVELDLARLRSLLSERYQVL